MKNKLLKLSFLTAAIVLSLFLSAFDAQAQTSKRRKRTKKTATTSSVLPISAQNTPYVDGNQIVLGEIPQPPTAGAPEPLLTAPVTDNSNDRDAQIRELNDRIKTLESANNKAEKQKQLLMNLDILTRAESRAESLRKQLFEIIEKENATNARLNQITAESSGEVIDRSVALSGSLRPEELREQRRKSLEAEKNSLESLLTQIQTNHAALDLSVQKADALVEKIRTKLEKEIDDALADPTEN